MSFEPTECIFHYSPSAGEMISKSPCGGSSSTRLQKGLHDVALQGESLIREQDRAGILLRRGSFQVTRLYTGTCMSGQLQPKEWCFTTPCDYINLRHTLSTGTPRGGSRPRCPRLEVSLQSPQTGAGVQPSNGLEGTSQTVVQYVSKELCKTLGK